jgi:hypothetical protein
MFKKVRFSPRFKRHSVRLWKCKKLCNSCQLFPNTPIKKLRKKRRTLVEVFNEPVDNNEGPDLIVSDGEECEEDDDNVNRLIVFDPDSPVANLLN